MTKITAPSGCNVYVASLPLDFTDPQLTELFAPFGAVSSARVMRCKGTRQSKGYGFVMFKDPRAAELAVMSLHGMSIGSTTIQVRIAHPGASKSVRNGQSPQKGQVGAPSDSLSSHTEDCTASFALSDATSTLCPSQSATAQMHPLLYPVPQPMVPMMPMVAPQPTAAYPSITMPQPMLRQDTLTLIPTVSQPPPMYVVILPDGRQAVMCGY